MHDDYSWGNGSRRTSSFRSPQSEGLGKWVVVAFLAAVVIHAAVLIGLSKIDIILPELVERKELNTEVVRVRPVDFDEPSAESRVAEGRQELEQPPIVLPADELDMLANAPEMEMDISPDIEKLEVPMSQPAMTGDVDGLTLEPVTAPHLEPDLPDMGKTDDFFPRSRDSQVTIDPGAQLDQAADPDAYVESLRKGAEGNADAGLLKDFTSLDAMARMDGNALLTSKALIGSDLLFDFNSSTLRESARVSLMKVALLIDKHPKLICWVDGHTDLIGGDEANLALSRERAMAVKNWLVRTLELQEDRVAVRGFGEKSPLVKSGDAEKQAPNRRVEIKLRRSLPEKVIETHTPEIKPASPARAELVEEDQDPVLEEKRPPRAVVEEEQLDEPMRPEPPRAIPVE